ncbi:hypothetical protein C8C77_10412 [Halanaerobium saccharolyticum]|uniref:Uncharacterized protein n=1 Tax=Halanaerobium saccharolyticum TaxID=43595 RepID=A0A4R7Z5P2_9FIRM|nr:hypothetical protein [Halanaerobium saccharolyticum]RAK10619.1 hypothetical protein C7958_104140 [Halanaerobium saccharolyticum]TDW06624.1 hypothetical protein C8C77_10412 [Halanaerobium saccharolyticum]TDX62259.1 hypothetical protein C7956_10412 [Halanaerobium saccharolyticum]
MFKKVTLFLLLSLFIFVFSAAGTAAGVRPLVLNFDLKPGDTADFELLLTPGSSRETVALIPYHPIQNLSGGLGYEVGDPAQHLALNWIELEQTEVVVPPNQEQVVQGQISVPYDAAGSHTAVIMIEQVAGGQIANPDFFNFQVRYAVRININIDRPGQRARAEITKLELNKNKEGNPQVVAHIKNSSSLHFNAGAEATVRDENNRLIERLNLVSEAAARANNLETRIYPESEVSFQADLSQPMFPGKYNLQIFLRYGNNRQLVERKEINLEEELRKSGEVRHLSIEPELIAEEIRAGSPVTQVIDLNNISNQNYKIKIRRKEVVENNIYSIFNLGELQLRGEEELELQSRNSERVVFIFRSPRDAAAGGYYGQLELAVVDENEKEIETQTIDLEILIGEEWEYSLNIEEFVFEKIEEVQTFTLDFKNSSPVHIIPRASMRLIDDENVTVETINLKLPEGKIQLLPEEKTTMTARTAELEAGTYTAEVVISNQNQEIDTVSQTVVIE